MNLEQQFIENINKNKLIIPEGEIDCEREFNYYATHKNLVNYFDTEDKVKNFLSNPTIQLLMVHYHVNPIEIEEVIGDYPIMEDWVGNPSSNGNLVHHAYSLNQLLKQINLLDIKSVFEFGGGYGSFIRLLRRMGFYGAIHSYDLPFFSELQKYFLGKLNINNVTFYSNKVTNPIKVDLFVGLWSFSESSLAVRRKILRSVSFKNCLIAYQPECNGIDNMEYFSKHFKSRRDMRFFDYEVPHLKSRYLIGIHERD